MASYIALFRSLNIGGNNVVKMRDLSASFESLGMKNVRTYIQSGNVVFDASRKLPHSFAAKVTATLDSQHGIQPSTIVFPASEFRHVVGANPFPSAITVPKSVHTFFLLSPASSPNLDALHSVKTDTESFELTDRALFLHTPDGFGRSKLPSKVERALGVKATARNWNTVQQLLNMIEATA